MLNGYIDRMENSRLKGWAFDPDDQATPAKLQLRYGDKEIFTFYANEYREDLKNAGMGSGYCGFDVKVPAAWLAKDESQLNIYSKKLKRSLINLRPIVDTRKQMSRIALQGRGIEVGALHNPLFVSSQATVTYVDRMSLADLVKHYPDFDTKEVTAPDIIDDGEKLSTFNDESQDFIIANHMLEHCENPIGTIRSHLTKIRPGGALFYIVPDMRFFLDSVRERTTFEHCLQDDVDGGAWSRKDHYLDWTRSWDFPKSNGSVDQENLIREKAIAYMQSQYSIHYHVWDQTTFFEFLQKTRDYLGHRFNIECYVFNFTEIITVLRKQ